MVYLVTVISVKIDINMVIPHCVQFRSISVIPPTYCLGTALIFMVHLVQYISIFDIL